MFRYGRLAAVVLVCFSSVAFAQNLCPPGVKSDKLICLIPQVYGPNGLQLPNAGSGLFNIVPHFQNILPDSLRPINSAISRQAALLPLASPSSGFTYTWDPAAKLFLQSTDSFGPIFGERADTVGKHRLFLGVDYQYFDFNRLDGISLKSLPAVFLQPDDSVAVPHRTCSVNGDNKDSCGFIRDVIATHNQISLKIHQFTTFITLGLTNSIDVSVAIPIENVRMAMVSNATVVPNSQTALHVFTPGCTPPCFSESFASFGTASGVGDMILRVKGIAVRGERAGVALGVDIRMPTGDSMNYLGAGAAGVKPFVVWSYKSRISPHAFAGYEVNGSSSVAGDISNGTKERLPSQFVYSGGADVWLTRWLTGSFDLAGQEVFEAGRVAVGALTEPAPCTDGNCIDFGSPNTASNIFASTGTFNVTAASFGVKVRAASTLLVTGNVSIRLNEGGLRSRAVPLAGLSYTF